MDGVSLQINVLTHDWRDEATVSVKPSSLPVRSCINTPAAGEIARICSFPGPAPRPSAKLFDCFKAFVE